MNKTINPVGLKGQEITDRMKELMGIQPITENRRTSVVELTKEGPDGKVYGIVRENHEYYIKVTNKKNNLTSDDFSYIGGLMNKKAEAHPSYAKALKRLNVKFSSLNEAYGVISNHNIFENDNLLNKELEEVVEEKVEELDEEVEEVTEAEEDETELNELEQAVEDMKETPKKKITLRSKPRLSIDRAMNEMDSIIENIENGPKKKIPTRL